MSPARKERKVATNLSLRGDLVQRAKALHLNLSDIMEAALEHAIREAERHAWIESNRDAIESYNERVEQRGVFSDDWRRF